VVAALQSKHGIIACEQPELHVHPRIQIGIGDLLTQANNNSSFLIETHSEHLVLRILRRIRETSEGELPEGLQPVSPTDVSIVYMEPGEAGVRTQQIEIDSSGEFTTRWPNGFFAERREELF
jgi:predicted ATPase